MSCTLEKWNDEKNARECNCVDCGTRYNGWTNYETWLLNVHDFVHGPSMQEKAERMLRKRISDAVYDGNTIGILQDVAYTLGTEAAESFDGLAGEILDTLEAAGYTEEVRRLMTDLLENFRGTVRWTELAGEHVEAVRYRLHWTGLGKVAHDA